MARVGRRVERALLHLYRDVPAVAVSESTRSDLLQLGFSDVRVVPPGRDEPPDVRDLPKESVPTFLFVGRLTANKRPAHAVAAFSAIKRALPLAQLWMIGSGPLELELRETAPPDVSFLGRVPREELFDRMARAHGLLVPSVREGWGLVVIEANSVGTPAIGYDVAGLRDSIRAGDTGLLARAGDPDSLAASAVSLVADGKRYAKMRGAASAWAERFSWDATASELLNIAELEHSRHTSVRMDEALAGSPTRNAGHRRRPDAKLRPAIEALPKKHQRSDAHADPVAAADNHSSVAPRQIAPPPRRQDRPFET
jgi:glycosyltransferase involved in cell wall biosynthesis